MIFKTIPYLAGQAITGTTAYASDPFDLQQAFKISAQITTASTATGTLKIQVSNDPIGTGTGFTPSNWYDLPSATVSVAGAGTVGTNCYEVCANWGRVVYTNATNSGTITGVQVRVNAF